MTEANGDAAKQSGVKLTGRPNFRTTPSDLREQARVYLEESRKSADPQMNRAFASAAFALAQLGECIERLTEAE